MDMKTIKQNITPAFWGAVAGAVALAIIGFNWGGWVSGSTAREMAQAAVVDRLIPICVGQFNADAGKTTKLAELKKIDSWKQAEFVAGQGWATMPGAKEPNSAVADGCATRIVG
jgi:hypothetical protein